jgi:uncharacterized SAM-binding protein YcdF (DUF218 family)
MFYVLSKILDVFLSPLVWAIIGLSLGLRWRKEPGRYRRAAGLAALAGLVLLSTTVVSSCLWRSLETRAIDSVRSNQRYDAVVLLGGVVDTAAMHQSDSNPSYNDNVERLLESYEWLRTDRAAVVVISGGSAEMAANQPVESTVLARQLVRWGIGADRIVEDNALNTRENATHVATLVRHRRWARVLVITSAFHSRRARGCFRAVGLEPDWLFVDRRAYDNTRKSGSWLPRAEGLRVSEQALRELAGWWVYRLRGWVRE